MQAGSASFRQDAAVLLHAGMPLCAVPCVVVSQPPAWQRCCHVPPAALALPLLMQPDRGKAVAVAGAVDAFNRWLLPHQTDLAKCDQAQEEKERGAQGMNSQEIAAPDSPGEAAAPPPPPPGETAAPAAEAAAEAANDLAEMDSCSAAGEVAGAEAAAEVTAAVDAGSEPEQPVTVLNEFVCDWLMRGLGAASLANYGGVPPEVAAAAAEGGSKAEAASAWLLQVRYQYYSFPEFLV